MMRYDRNVAGVWLGAGAKYAVSASWYCWAWWQPLQSVLDRHGIRLDHATSLRQVVDAFRGKVFWRSDELWQAADLVKPPAVLLAEQGDDCDGSAMLWGQAVEFALGHLGHRATIVSYLADPWHMSHHVCLVDVPGGGWVAIQPPPAREQDPNLDPIVCEPTGEPRYFKAPEQAAREVASWYGATVQGFDSRDARWRVIEPWRWLS